MRLRKTKLVQFDIPQIPDRDCTPEWLDAELRRVLKMVVPVGMAVSVGGITSTPTQAELHLLGHIVAQSIMLAHGYHARNYHVDDMSFLCRLISENKGMESRHG